MFYDDVIKWNHFPRYWPYWRGIHRSPVDSSHKGQWRGVLMFSLIWTKAWASNRDAGDLRRHCAHYDVIVMLLQFNLGISGRLLVQLNHQWVLGHGQVIIYDRSVMTHSSSNVNDNIDMSSSKIRYWWLIISHSKQRNAIIIPCHNGSRVISMVRCTPLIRITYLWLQMCKV